MFQRYLRKHVAVSIRVVKMYTARQPLSPHGFSKFVKDVLFAIYLMNRSLIFKGQLVLIFRERNVGL